MPLSPGTRFGPYQILGPLGAGGMGEVYRAVDSKLSREVALKVLPSDFAADADRMARFEREARMLAALNHQNIAGIYGFEGPAIIMELVPGATLEDRLAAGAIPIGEALPIARQIAEGLEAAHERGIVHRDLKPANIKITPEGVVKLLDFGLAKAAEERPVIPGSPTISPTVALTMTEAGVIMGTAAYMSPEQAAGKPVDKRADIWSFGVVLYEMLTGTRLFAGETVSHTLADVLRAVIDLDRLPAGTPPAIRTVLSRCLDRSAAMRLRDIGEARCAIQTLGNPSETPIPHQRRRWLLVAAGFALGLILATAATLAMIGRRASAPSTNPVVTRFEIPPPEGTILDRDSLAAPQVVPSPDGRLVALVLRDLKTGHTHLWLRELGSPALRRLEGTEDASLPFWSPDSQFIGYFGDHDLRRIPAGGGIPQAICSFPADGEPITGDGATWNSDGVIVFSPYVGKGLMRVSASGGKPTSLTTLNTAHGEVRHSFPQFLPDGKRFLFFAATGNTENSGVYVHELESAQQTLVLRNATRAAWAPPEHLLYAREGTLLAQRMDARTLQPVGSAITVATGITDNVLTGRAGFAVSESGVLVYRQGNLSLARQLRWYDHQGRLLSNIGKPGSYRKLALAPDGRRAALIQGNILSLSGDSEGWIVDLASGVARAIPTGPLSAAAGPVWSPDSQWIAASRKEGGIVRLPAVSGTPVVLTTEKLTAHDWSRDGRSLICTDGADAVVLLPVSPANPGETKPQTLLVARDRKTNLRFSPDGRWVAYVSNETGVLEAFIAAFPSFAGRQQISRGGGRTVEWRNDGKGLHYLNGESALIEVEVKLGPRIEVGQPKTLMTLIDSIYTGALVAPDGRILVQEGDRKAGEFRIVVVLNWAAELKRAPAQ